MDVSPVLVADLQAPEAVEPGERPFDHPAVASQAVLGLDTTAFSPTCAAVLLVASVAGWAWVVTHPGLPQIRTCRIPASGSSAHGFAAQMLSAEVSLRPSRRSA